MFVSLQISLHPYTPHSLTTMKKTSLRASVGLRPSKKLVTPVAPLGKDLDKKNNNKSSGKPLVVQTIVCRGAGPSSSKGEWLFLGSLNPHAVFFLQA